LGRPGVRSKRTCWLGELATALADLGTEGSAREVQGIGEDTETLASDAAGLTESLGTVHARVRGPCELY
jgi:hypothetical protein